MKTKNILWPNNRPESCPYPQSESFKGILLTGKYANYTNADTYYPTWATDGHLYSAWTDGYVDGEFCHSFTNEGKVARTGQIKIVGDAPFDLTYVNLGHMEATQAPYGGRYPCGGLVYDGVWYHGSYCLTTVTDDFSECGSVGWSRMGPFVGYRTSTDWDHYTVDWEDGFWEPCPHTGEAPLFKEDPLKAQVKIGAPHFVDFGQNLTYSPDGKAYLVAQGSTDPEAWNSWIQADQVYLLRVTPGIETMNDSAAYEYYAGKNLDGSDRWSSDFNEIQPILEWKGKLGCVTITYNAPLNKYLMCITRGVRQGHYDTMILESDQMTGDWKMIHYLEDFGNEAYFVNIPSKFISSDGKTATLWYSANFSDNPWGEEKTRPEEPPGSNYSLVVQEIVLVE